MIVALTREPARDMSACELTHLERRPVDAAFPRTAEMLSRRGYAVRTIEVSEFAKAEGGLTCMSLIFEQQAVGRRQEQEAG